MVLNKSTISPKLTIFVSDRKKIKNLNEIIDGISHSACVQIL